MSRRLNELEMWNLRLGRTNAVQQTNSASASTKANAAPQRAEKRFPPPDSSDESSASSEDDEVTRKKKELFLAQLDLCPNPKRPRPNAEPVVSNFETKRAKKPAKN